MLIHNFFYFKCGIKKIFVVILLLISSCKNCDNKKNNNSEQISLNQNSSEKENNLEIINFGRDIIQTTKALAIVSIDSISSFSDKESLLLEFIQSKGANFIKNFAPGPFSMDVFESISNETCWELQKTPDILAWYSKNIDKGDFIITDSLGMPQKSTLKTIINNNELISFLFLDEKLQKEKIYYIYFRQADKFSFVQNVKFIN